MRDRRGGTGEGDSIEDALVCLFGIKECYIVHVLSNSHAMHGCVGIKGMGMDLKLVLTEMRALRI